jgi:tRNA A37 threonylcarbamoyladenosine modification protein TsaB
MKIRIKIKNQTAEVLLFAGRKIIDRELLADFGRLSEELLPAVDRLLKRHKITLRDIQKIDSAIDLPESYTATRIVKAVVKGLSSV